jgi:hypothetical protein
MLDFGARGMEREEVALTRPRIRFISSAKWEVNITRKYSVASFAMISQRFVNPSPGVLNLFAKKIINENASKSEVSIF